MSDPIVPPPVTSVLVVNNDLQGIPISFILNVVTTSAARQQWEYKVYEPIPNNPNHPPPTLEQQLSALGNDGWELIMLSGLGPPYFLKRPKQL